MKFLPTFIFIGIVFYLVGKAYGKTSNNTGEIIDKVLIEDFANPTFLEVNGTQIAKPTIKYYILFKTKSGKIVKKEVDRETWEATLVTQ